MYRMKESSICWLKRLNVRQGDVLVPDVLAHLRKTHRESGGFRFTYMINYCVPILETEVVNCIHQEPFRTGTTSREAEDNSSQEPKK